MSAYVLKPNSKTFRDRFAVVLQFLFALMDSHFCLEPDQRQQMERDFSIYIFYI